MKKLFQMFKELIFKDVIRENEAKDTAVLLRSLALLSFAYHLAMFITSLRYLHLLESIYSALALFLIIVIFVASYKDKTILCLYAFCILSVLDAGIKTLFTGSSHGFQYIISLSVLLIFFRTEGNMKLKYIFSILCGIIVCALSTTPGTSVFHDVDHSVLHIFFALSNCIYITIALIIISRFYCMKFSESEHKIIQYSKKLEHLASVDALTGLQNRRSMMTHLERLAKNYEHSEIPFSIVIADIDHFKKVNDTYGHDTGDYVLKKLAEIFRNFMAEKGYVARWGGEEFLFTFEGSNADFIFVELNNLKSLIEHTQFHFNEQDLHITLTFGLEEFDSGAGLLSIISKADQKLYIGKEQGRNRVIY